MSIIFRRYALKYFIGYILLLWSRTCLQAAVTFDLSIYGSLILPFVKCDIVSLDYNFTSCNAT